MPTRQQVIDFEKAKGVKATVIAGKIVAVAGQLQAPPPAAKAAPAPAPEAAATKKPKQPAADTTVQPAAPPVK